MCLCGNNSLSSSSTSTVLCLLKILPEGRWFLGEDKKTSFPATADACATCLAGQPQKIEASTSASPATSRHATHATQDSRPQKLLMCYSLMSRIVILCRGQIRLFNSPMTEASPTQLLTPIDPQTLVALGHGLSRSLDNG